MRRVIGGAMAVLLVQLLGGLSLLSIAVLAPIFEIAAIAFVVRNVLANLAWPLQQSMLMTIVVPEERATAAFLSAPFRYSRIAVSGTASSSSTRQRASASRRT